MFNALATVLGSLVLMGINRPTTGFPSLSQLWDYKLGLIPVALCTTFNLGCNNISLTLVSLFLNQAIKATGPIPTMLFSFLLEKKSYSLATMAATAGIVGGLILALPMKSGGPATSIEGVIFCFTSLLAASLKPVIMKLVMTGTETRPKLAPTVVMFYDFALAFWFMLFYWVLSAERAASVEYMSSHTWAAVGILCAGSAMAFVFNLSNYFYVQLTSALTMTIASNGVKVVNLVLSAFTDHLTDPRNWAGVAVVCASIWVYAYIGYVEKTSKAPPPPQKGDAETAGKPSEATPLATAAPTESDACCTIS